MELQTQWAMNCSEVQNARHWPSGQICRISPITGRLHIDGWILLCWIRSMTVNRRRKVQEGSVVFIGSTYFHCTGISRIRSETEDDTAMLSKSKVKYTRWPYRILCNLIWIWPLFMKPISIYCEKNMHC